jgi:nitrate/nitrite transport system substrate-binding protein
MKRRELLKYGTLAACSYSLAACQNRLGKNRTSRGKNNPVKLDLVKPENLGQPEKTKLALGYAPTIAIAPWLVAIEQGYFEKFGLEVSLYKQPNTAEVERGLVESRFDAAITPFSTPLINQLKSPRIDFVALMQLHRHGSVFVMNQQTWDAKIRSSFDYTNFNEFADDYREYVRSLPNKSFAVDDLYSVSAYLYRYWWAAIGFHPELDLKLLEFAPTELPYKLQAKAIQGYSSLEPWGQQAIMKRQGYIGYLANDVWWGHPGSVITTDAGWVKENPNTAKALMAASLMGCEYCQDSANAKAIAKLAKEPLGTHISNIETLLNGQYFYGGSGDRPIPRRDSPIWLDFGQRLTAPDHANYCWQSHGIWLLTQMTRWQHFGLKFYPKNAENLVAAAYPNDPYNQVAEAFGITLPPNSRKDEFPFIDQRSFSPKSSEAYINQFKIRT